MTLPTWSVAVVVKNSTFEVLRFIAWYLEAGATRVHILFHDPTDPHIALASAHPNVDAVAFTDEVRAAMGVPVDQKDPPAKEIGTFFYPRAQTDWMIRVDCDELLYCEDRTFSDMLATVPEDRMSVRVLPAEALPHDGIEQLFRLPMDPEAVHAVYGDDAPLMLRRWGLICHAAGKSAHRTGVAGLAVMEHHAELPETRKRPPHIRLTKEHGVYLLHYNGEVFEDWARAAGRRAYNSSFGPEVAAEVRDILGAPDETARLRVLFDRVNGFGPDRIARMEALDLCRHFDFDHAALIERHFPGMLAAQLEA